MSRGSPVRAAQLISATLFLVVGGLTWWGARELPAGTMDNLQPGFFPRVFGVLLTVLSLIMLAGLLRQRRRPAVPAGGDSPDGGEAGEPTNLRGVLLMSAVFVLYLILAYGVGHTAATLVAVAACGYLLGLRSPWRLALLAGMTAVTSWLLFERWLGVSLPPGRWF